jgi:hypothetical protein
MKDVYGHICSKHTEHSIQCILMYNRGLHRAYVIGDICTEKYDRYEACDGPVHILPYDPQCHALFVIYSFSEN